MIEGWPLFNIIYKSKRLSSPNLIQTTYRQLTNIVLNITTQVMWCQFMLNAVTIGYSHTIKNSLIVYNSLIINICGDIQIIE